MSRPVAIMATLIAGGVIALQPPSNAALADHVGDFGAGLISGAITVTLVSVGLLLFGHPSQLRGLTSFRPEHAIGGIGGATVVVVSLVAVRPLGTGTVIALLVAAQLVVSVIADRYGWLGVHVVGLSAGRLIGLGLVIGGTLLITRT